MTGRLLTARNVAETLGVSTETVLRYYRAGKLPAVRLPGGAIRFEPAAIEARIAAWSTAAPARPVLVPLDASTDEA